MSDLSQNRFQLPNTECIVLRVVMTLEMGTRYEGVAHIILGSQKQIFGWTAIFQQDQEEKWKITGPGAMLAGGGRVPNPSVAPFSLDPMVNIGFKNYLHGLLCEKRGIKNETRSNPVSKPTPSPDQPQPPLPPPVPEPESPKPPVVLRTYPIPGVLGYTILSFGLKTEEAGVFIGQAEINNRAHRLEYYDWTAYHLGDGKWWIEGKGGLMGNGERIKDVIHFPFSIYPPINLGFKEVLVKWLNENHPNSPIVEPKPQLTTETTETKGSTMPPPGKTTPEIQRIFEAVYKIRETDEKTVLNGTERKDSRSRQIIALIMMETIEEKSMAQLAEYLKLEAQRFRSVVYSAKKYRDEEPDFKAEYRAVIKELGVDEPSSPTADKSRGGAGKNRLAQHHETLLSREDIVLILWKAMGMGSGDIAQVLNIGRSEVEQSIGAIVLSASNGEDPIKGRFKQIGEKILQLADS